jgi:RimJ/RimL family protein N-acetyltransferase
MLADPEVTRFIFGAPTKHDAWRSLAFITGHWVARGYGFWAVEHKSNHAMIGRIGLWNPEGWPSLELAWTLTRDSWGQGLAYEAACAAMDFAFTKLDAPRLTSHIDEGNIRSQNLARRLGERHLGPIAFDWGTRHIDADAWEITRAEWERAQS